jgi:hypothetical protein
MKRGGRVPHGTAAAIWGLGTKGFNDPLSSLADCEPECGSIAVGRAVFCSVLRCEGYKSVMSHSSKARLMLLYVLRLEGVRCVCREVHGQWLLCLSRMSLGVWCAVNSRGMRLLLLLLLCMHLGYATHCLLDFAMMRRDLLGVCQGLVQPAWNQSRLLSLTFPSMLLCGISAAANVCPWFTWV